MRKDKIAPGMLCMITPRGKSVLGYEIFGIYLDCAGNFVNRKTTGVEIDIAKTCARSMPFITLTSRKLNAGMLVVIVHEPIVIENKKARSQMGLRPHSTICEVLTPVDGRTRWVRSGLLSSAT